MTTQIINNLTVEIDGPDEGDVVLCIHGLGGTSNVWTPLMPSLRNLKVVRADLPGSGRSALLDQPLSIERYVASLAELLDALDVESVHVLAHSLGTIVAQHLAVTHPGKVKSLLLFGPLVAPPDAGRPGTLARANLARTGVAAMQEIADAVAQAATSKETKAEQPVVLALIRESLMRQLPEGYAQSCEALARAQSAAIEQISVPTLLITGDQDGVAPAANVQVMASRIPGSEQIVLEGCGHWTTFERPQQCAEQVHRFHESLR